MITLQKIVKKIVPFNLDGKKFVKNQVSKVP